MNETTGIAPGRPLEIGIAQYMYNPGNLKYKSRSYLIGCEGQYKGFCIFAAPLWGCRALIKRLRFDIHHEKLRTVTKIITAFAPPADNNTKEYIQQICMMGAFDPDKVYPWTKTYIVGLAKQITAIEHGWNQYDLKTWFAAYEKSLDTLNDQGQH